MSQYALYVGLVRSRPILGLPKNDKERQTPLPDSVAAVMQQYFAAFPPVSVTLPWEDPHRVNL
jgi:hypothetical protein